LEMALETAKSHQVWGEKTLLKTTPSCIAAAVIPFQITSAIRKCLSSAPGKRRYGLEAAAGMAQRLWSHGAATRAGRQGVNDGRVYRFI
jgi:hypothetical protein